jgi:hypothetical protein
VKCPICDEELFLNIPTTVSKETIAKNTTGIVYNCLKSGTGFAGYQNITSNLNLCQINSRRYEASKHLIGEELILKK